jgi:hypothetical protein
MVRWNNPEPEVAVYHRSETCYSWDHYAAQTVAMRKGQHRGQIQVPHDKIVPHVILFHHAP